jgi:hypothetical protein
MAPASADEGQVGNIAHPDLIRRSGRGLAQEQVFGYDDRGVSYRGARALRSSAQRPQAATA